MSITTNNSSTTTICIYNVNIQTNENDLIEFFNKHIIQPIVDSNVRIVRCPETNRSRGIAWITFHSNEDYSRALQLNDQVLNDRHLRIS